MSRFLLLTCLFSFFLVAQTPDTATLRGQVIDQTHAAVPMVQVTVTNTLTALKRTVQTDDSGNYSIAGLPIGTYDVVAVKQGFAEMKPANVTLAGGTTADVDLTLNAAEEQRRLPSPGRWVKCERMAPNWATVWTRSRWRKLLCSIGGSPTCPC